MQWNDFACELIARNQVGQFPALRVLGHYLNLAIHNAIVGARRKDLPPDGAAAGAAAVVLAQLFPKEEQAIATRLAGEKRLPSAHPIAHRSRRGSKLAAQPQPK